MNPNTTEGQKSLIIAQTLIDLLAVTPQTSITTSNNIKVTNFSNSTSLAALTAAVGTYLSTSTNKYVSTFYFTSNIVTVVYMAVVTERLS